MKLSHPSILLIAFSLIIISCSKIEETDFQAPEISCEEYMNAADSMFLKNKGLVTESQLIPIGSFAPWFENATWWDLEFDVIKNQHISLVGERKMGFKVWTKSDKYNFDPKEAFDLESTIVFYLAGEDMKAECTAPNKATKRIELDPSQMTITELPNGRYLWDYGTCVSNCSVSNLACYPYEIDSVIVDMTFSASCWELVRNASSKHANAVYFDRHVDSIKVYMEYWQGDY